jgi:hypothetical protein
MVTDADIIESLTLALSQTFGGLISRPEKKDTTTTFAIGAPPHARYLRVSDDWIAIAASRGRRVTANDSDLRPAFDAITNCKPGGRVFLPAEGPLEVMGPE